MNKYAKAAFRAMLVVTLPSVICGRSLPSQTPAKIAVTTPERITVEGSGPESLLKVSADIGRLSPDHDLGRMVLQLRPTPKQEIDAAKLVRAQNDPSSPSFHHWLTAAEFGQRFGVSDESASQASRWLQAQGLTVHEVAKSRRFIVFSGNVAQVENAFSTEMHSYAFHDQTFISNSTDIKIPAALQSMVKGVVRLHSDPASAEMVLGKKVPFQKKSGQFTFGDGSHYLTPADVAKIYNIQPLYDAGIDGTGQTIAIVGRSNIDVQNVRDFRKLMNLPVNDPEIIVNGDDPSQTADAGEAMLDVTWSGAVAPKAHIKFVVSQSNFADGVDVSAAYIVDHDLAPVMSTSYGSCETLIGPIENDFFNSLWQQAAAEGITAFVSAGDNGGAGCDAPAAGNYSSGYFAVNGLASTPYNVAVGGTQFDDTANPDTYWSPNTNPLSGLSALGYIPEKVWNESSNAPNGVLLYAGSGGVSRIYPKPEWQTGAGVPNDGARDVPDISFSAGLHDGYLFCFQSQCSYGAYFYTAGGTSVSSPVSAGIMALVNQQVGGQPQGLANYVFYRLASVPGIFHDTTVGNNRVPDPDGQFTIGYDAAPGYDLATGLGSFDVAALVNHWKGAVSSTASTTTLALASGQASKVVHGTPVALNASVSCSGGGACSTPVGSVALTATSGSVSKLGLGATTLDANGNASIQSSSIPGGTYSIAARYSGDGTYAPSTSAAIPVTVTPEASQTVVGSIGGGSFTQGPITIEYGLYWQVGVAVAGKSGFGYPTGNLSLTQDGQPFPTYSYDFAHGVWVPSTLQLNYGEKSTLLFPWSSAEASSISYVVPYPGVGLPALPLGVGTHKVVAAYPGDPSFGPSSGTYSYNIVPAQSAIVDFFPIGDQVANVPVGLAGQLAFTNGGYAPYGGTVTITDITGAAPAVLGTAPLSPDYGGSYSIPVTVKDTGTHTIRVDFSGDANVKSSFQTYEVPFPANDASYTSLSTDVSGTAAGQPITLTANVSSNIRLYTATGTVTFLNGSTSIGTATLDAKGNAVLVVTSLPAGTDNLSASYPGDAALQPSISNTSAATVADYLLQAFPAGLQLKEGQGGTVSINLTPLGGFAQKVTLQCSGMPANGSCSIPNSSVTLDGTHPSNVSIVINTGGTVTALTNNGGNWNVPASVALAGLLLLPFRKRKWVTTGFCMLLAVSFLAVGCGGKSKSNQVAPGSYNIQITATTAGETTPKAVMVSIIVNK